MNSDTPRTDREETEHLDPNDFDLVPASFARQLERELNLLTKEYERLNKEAKEAYNILIEPDFSDCRARWAAVTALKGGAR